MIEKSTWRLVTRICMVLIAVAAVQRAHGVLASDLTLPPHVPGVVLWLDCLGWFRSPDGHPLVFDFEGETYDGWKVEGEAFGPGPAHGTLPGQMPVTGFLGKGLVNSFYKGDATTGILTSPVFVIERKFISFLIGGGKYPGQTCINLIVDGKVVRTATGPNDKPGGSEQLDWHQWEVAELDGKTATLQIVDQATGGWGHINVDQIIQTDHRLPVLVDQSRELRVERRYLNLPVKNGPAKRRVSFLIGGKVEREFEIELADREPDFWTFADLSSHKGKRLTVRVERLPEDSLGLKSIEQTDQFKGAENLYREKLRPQFHFTSRRAGTTTRTVSCITEASTTCSTSTTPMASPGATCTGVMPSARTSCTGGS